MPVLLPSCRLRLRGGRPEVVVDGGPVPRPGRLRALAVLGTRVTVRQLPDDRVDLDWLLPIASQVTELDVLGACEDLGALQHLPRLRALQLGHRPRRGTVPLVRQATTLRDYAGPWFPALEPVLASRGLRRLLLEHPPQDLAARLTAPLDTLRLLSARRLSAVPDLACVATLTSLVVAGGGALDLGRLAGYTALRRLDVHGRTPLTSFAALTGCPSLRELVLEECYAVDDVSALRGLTLDELRLVGRPESLDPELLATARELGVRRFSAPPRR